MRRVLSIAQLNLLEIFRDRSELVSVIGLPLLLTWVFGAAFGAGGAGAPTSVPVADLDRSVYSAIVVAAIDAPESSAVRAVDEASARKLVADGQASAAIIVPADFSERLEDGKDARIIVLRDPTSDAARAVMELADGAATRVHADIVSARTAVEHLGGRESLSGLFEYADTFWEPEPPVSVVSRVVLASEARANELEAPANTQYSLGFTVFFVTMVALGSAGGVLEERELGTLRRLLAAPVRRSEVLLGKTLGVAGVAGFEALMLVGFGALVFGVPWGSDPLAVAILLLALVVAVTGLGVMLSALVRTRSQMSAITPVLSTALAMLGGCYWPIEITSPLMQQAAKLTPTGWAMAGLKDVVARGMGVEAALVPAAVLLTFGAVTLAIGVSRLKLE